MNMAIRSIAAFAALFAIIAATGCGKKHGLSGLPVPLLAEKVDGPGSGEGIGSGGSSGGNTSEEGGGTHVVDAGLHPLFTHSLGSSVSSYRMSSYLDRSGLSIAEDYDGDGISNEDELHLGLNPHVCDYPRVTVQTSPATMELQYRVSGETKRYRENISSEDVTNKSNRSMDETHYNKMKLSTTPYVVKESSSEAGSSANSYGYSQSNEMSFNSSFGFGMLSFDINAGLGLSQKTSKSENWSFANSFSRSSMSERTVFEDINYRDNMDSNGITLSDAKVMEMTSRFRQSEAASDAVSYGPNDGLIEASITFKNESLNIPVKISNVRCTALLKLPSGKFEALQTFLLKDRDGYPFEVEIGGGDKTSEYAVVVEGLNSEKIRNALRNGYLPVISVFSYDMTAVDDSWYRPGLVNLKQVEEAAKGRTAVIKINAPNKREWYRVAAFDVDQSGALVPGISLKKALFNIYRSPFRGGERYERDARGRGLTIPPEGMWWHDQYVGSGDWLSHEYLFGSNLEGNEWDYFSTEVKSYTDEWNQVKRLETIKRIGNERDVFGNFINAKYNPFKDYRGYDESEPLPESELLKTKYWVILHNGKYYEGDINDPIWPGDRYEIVLYSVAEFREYCSDYVYTPLQSGELIKFDTRWNAKLNLSRELARSTKLGTVRKGEVVRLDVWLKESRFLFEQSQDADAGAGLPYALREGDSDSPKAWWDFRYTFEPPSRTPNGIPGGFTHRVTGGVNNLTVAIDESKNAHYYIIEITDCNNAYAPTRRVKITASDLAAGSGTVYLHSRVAGDDGNAIGLLRETNYRVKVYAHGSSYGHPVRTPSASNFGPDSLASVRDASTQLPSPNFTFSAQNLQRDAIHVRIPDWPNTEYFLIRCQGPFNYGKGSWIKEVRGHAGLNIIPLEHPYRGLQEAPEPGVYEVRVYAVNRNGYREGGEDMAALEQSQSRLGEVVVNVEYMPYVQQRVVAPFKYLPESELANDSSAAVRSFGIDAIDLEVNFNEGSGWWRLKLANNDRGAKFTGGLRREIDCRLTSVVEDYENQHFAIYFKAPDGEQNRYLNVFKTSDTTVDLYIRTVAENKYRDTFWIKKLTQSSLFEPGTNCIVTPARVGNFITYWSGLDGTDASRFTESLAAWRIDSVDVFNGLIGLFEGVRSDANYFFSPLEQRVYHLSAKLADPGEYMSMPPSRIDLPRFTATSGPGCVYLNNIESRYADGYEIWWRRFDRTGPQVDLTLDGVGWDDSADQPLQPELWGGPANIEPDETGACDFTIPELDPYQNYVVAVVGVNTAINGRSKARFAFDKNCSGDNIGFVTPYPNEPPREAPSMDVAVDGRSILVSNIKVEDQCRYIIRWCEVVNGVDGTWRSLDTYRDSGKQVTFGPVSYAIRDLNPASWYRVQTYAVTLNDLKGPVTERLVQTGKEGNIVVRQKWVIDPEYILGSDNIYRKNGTSMLSVSLPAGTAFYRIYGTTRFRSLDGWLCWPNQHFRDFDSGMVGATNTEAPILRLEPWHAYWIFFIGINHIAHDSFWTSYTIEAFNTSGTLIERQSGDLRY